MESITKKTRYRLNSEPTINFITRGIKYACENFKGRTAGSKSEHACQHYFANMLKKWAHALTLETYTLHPKAFSGFLLLSGALGMISVIFYWLSASASGIALPVFSVTAIALSIAVVLFEFVLYRRFIDFLFPKATSVNLYAVRTPKAKVKRRIIFSGHADASYEMTYSFHGNKRVLLYILWGHATGLICVLIFNSIWLIKTAAQGPVQIEGLWKTIGICELSILPFFIAAMYFFNWNRVVDGANDNLSACFVAIGILKELSERNITFDHTEVCCLITGGEESGLRGAEEFANKHKQELSETETIVIALDTLREACQLKVYIKGLNGLQKNSDSVARLIKLAANKCGSTVTEAGLYPGATDAEAFSRNGIKACALCGVDHNPQLYYHTRKDTWSNIDKRCLQLSLDICLETVELYDEKGSIDAF